VLLWFWDILFHYACLGMIMFAFRRLSSKALLIGAFVSLLLMTARENVDAYRDRQVIYKGERLAKLDTSIVKLTDKQKEDLGEMTAFREKYSIEGRQKRMQKNLAAVRGSYAELYNYHSERSFRSEVNYLYYGGWDILVFMFLGMAFFKNGILTGQASAQIYWAMFIGGLGIGLLVSWMRLQPLIDYKFNIFDYTKYVRFEYYEISRTLRAIGIFGLIMVLYKSGLFRWFFNLMRPVGQMAFTNYLMQSLLVGLFFYGIGLGMYGKLQRFEMYYVVAGTWLLEIVWSHIWLRYFRFGPLEWLWRSLTYWKLQPFRKTTGETAAVILSPAVP
jgi:uncharacterized protein